MEKIYESIDKFLSILEDKEDVFGVLHFVQSKLGYIPNEAQQYIADKMKISLDEVKEIVNISSYFLEEKSKNEILVCTGLACSLKGSKFIFDKLQDEINRKNIENVNLDTKKCFGLCQYGVNVSVDGTLNNNITTDNFENIIKKLYL